MENKQTAVEWLESQLEQHAMISVYAFEDQIFCRKLLKQAKAMEKEQIKDSFDTGYSYDLFNGGGEQYYEETYGTKKNGEESTN
jgi:hypothetical protein